MVDFSLDIPEPQEDEETATDDQKGYIRDLIRKTGSSTFPEWTLNDLGKWQASSLIDQLKDLEATLGGDSSKFDESKFTNVDDTDLKKFTRKTFRTVILVTTFILIALILSFND